jgi:hypothetical protein
MIAYNETSFLMTMNQSLLFPFKKTKATERKFIITGARLGVLVG